MENVPVDVETRGGRVEDVRASGLEHRVGPGAVGL